MFSKSFVLIVSLAVVVVFGQQSNSAEESIMDCVKEFDTKLNNKEYMSFSDNAFKAIDQVNKAADAAEQRASAENLKKAIKEAQKGYQDSIKCVAVSGYTVYKANNEVRDSSDAEAAKQKLQQANKEAKQIIGAAGLAAYLRVGAASEIAQKQVKKSIQYITFAGQDAYNGLDVAADLGISGLNSNGVPKEQSLNASSEAVRATGASCYIELVESAKFAFRAIDGSRPATPENTASDSAAARQSSQASSAIESVKTQAKSAESQNKDAVNVIQEGVIAAIKGFAGTITKLIQILRANEKTQNSEACRTIWEAGTEAQSRIAYAAANAYQGLGRAAQKVGGDKKDKFTSALAIVEAARAAAYNGIENAMQLAVTGLRNGDTAATTGVKAAIDSILSGTYLGYESLVKAAGMGFDILKS